MHPLVQLVHSTWTESVSTNKLVVSIPRSLVSTAVPQFSQEVSPVTTDPELVESVPRSLMSTAVCNLSLL